MNPFYNNSSSDSMNSKLKVVFLGEQSTGKTSILTRFIDDKFYDGLGATVGIDFMAKTVIVNQKALRIQFWDTAGQERFRSLIPNYLKEAVIAFIVFDVSNEKSFTNLPEWIDLCNQNMREKSNKCDLEERQVSEEQGREKASEYNLTYFEVSAKTGHMIKESLNFACSELMKTGKKKIMDESSLQEQKGNMSVRINNRMTSQSSTSDKKGRRCC